MKRFLPSWDSLLIASLVVLSGVCAQSQQMASAQGADEGKVVTIAPDDGVGELTEETRVVEEPVYWIGIRGRSIESEVLRTHFQLAGDMGVVVEDVVAESPAAKAGLRKHDIILRCNNDTVDDMRVLQSQVRAGKDKPLELKIIRLAKQEKIVVVPELRPEQLSEPANSGGQFGRNMEGDIMGQLMQQFGGRNIGPGMVFRGGGGGQRFNLNQMPNGVSVSIQRNNDEPAQITVKKGDQTWQIEGDDEESLKQLPDDVRPFVERMLNGQGNAQAFGGEGIDFGELGEELQDFLPRGLGGFQRARRPDRFGDPVLERMEQMERRLEELNNRLNLNSKWQQVDPLPKETRETLKEMLENNP